MKLEKTKGIKKMKHYYKDNRDVKYQRAEPMEEPDRVDRISYTPIGKQVENFIASGQVVTSLRAITAQEEKVQKTLDEVLTTPMTEFERHIYGMDITEAYQILKKFDAEAKKREMDEKEAEERKKRIKEYVDALDKHGVDTSTR